MNTIDTNTNQVNAGKSLDLISLSIALAFKWEKQEYTDKINLWMNSFSKSMSASEKDEFVKTAKELDLI